MPSKMKKPTSVARTKSTPKRISARVTGRGKRSATAAKKTTKTQSKAKSAGRGTKTSGRATASRAKSPARKATAAKSSRSTAMRSRSKGKPSRAKAPASRSSSRTKKTTARSTKRPAGKASGRGARSRSSAVTTTDHDEIRRWVDSRRGTPSTVVGTERDSESAGLLRIDFPGYSGKGSLEKVDWDDFFEKFEESKLAFLYDPDKGSKFNKFVERKAARRRR